MIKQNLMRKYMYNKNDELFCRIMKQDMDAIDKIETLEDAKEIIVRICTFNLVLNTIGCSDVFYNKQKR